MPLFALLDVKPAVDIFTEQLLYLGGCNTKSSPIEELGAFRLLARIGTNLIGGPASTIIRERIDELKLAIQQDLSASSQEKPEPMDLVYATASEILCEDYCNEMMPLLQMWKKDKFPEAKRLNFKWFCETVGCDNIESVDGRGWNPLHHLFHAAASRETSMNILWNIGKGKDKMPDGDTGAHAVHQQRHAFPEEAGHTDAA